MWELLRSEGEKRTTIKTRMRRLLVADRGLGKTRKSSLNRGAYAFYSQQPLGTGYDNHFSDVNALALLTGYLLLRHGFPQLRAVELIRLIQPKLNAILTDPEWKGPRGSSSNEPLKSGQIAWSHPNFGFLVLARPHVTVATNRRRSELPAVELCHNEKALWSFMHARQPGEAVTILQLGSVARSFFEILEKTIPRTRGRQ